MGTGANEKARAPAKAPSYPASASSCHAATKAQFFHFFIYFKEKPQILDFKALATNSNIKIDLMGLEITCVC